ncbi:glycosyltransferase [Bradyrhizobium sp. sBnM-33]|uniref:glycosyltransferase n=1 Tax=Bradyrhizobium sp. sBnM-33 TaxID=2831780 RepID=UPI001BCE58CA|nr:glycosyltransferase [Bradyrhizobium sp. sBnM-33]WOH53849.1 glycosyltransferase [Bradyrhizobium sp. sBnM-33]
MRILYVISFPPFPIEISGGAIRSHLLLSALNQVGSVRILYLNYRGPDHDFGSAPSSAFDDKPLSVLSISMPGTSGSKYENYLEKASRGLGMVFGSGLAMAGLRVSIEAARTIAELCDRGEVDLIVGRFCRTSAAAGLLAERTVPLIIDADDWEPSRTAARIRSTSRYNLLQHAYLQRALQGSLYLGRQVLEKADHVWLASEKDTAVLDRRHVTTLPNLPLSSTGDEINALKPSAAESKILLSVGDWGRKQNTDGMNWYLRQVWPLIRERVPQAELRIAGATQSSFAREWGAKQNVSVLGFVDELRSEYEKAAVIATPITWGGGTKIKVLEALAYGRVPAGTKHAFEGLPDPGKLETIAAIADEPVPLAEATVGMLINAPMRQSQEIAAAKYYVDHHSVAAFNKRVKDTVESVMSARKAQLC